MLASMHPDNKTAIPALLLASLHPDNKTAIPALLLACLHPDKKTAIPALLLASLHLDNRNVLGFLYNKELYRKWRISTRVADPNSCIRIYFYKSWNKSLVVTSMNHSARHSGMERPIIIRVFSLWKKIVIIVYFSIMLFDTTRLVLMPRRRKALHLYSSINWVTTLLSASFSVCLIIYS